MFALMPNGPHTGARARSVAEMARTAGAMARAVDLALRATGLADVEAVGTMIDGRCYPACGKK
jgi:hypothetical protein